MEIEKMTVGKIVIEDNTSLVNIKDSRITNTTLTTQARGDVLILKIQLPSILSYQHFASS
jgi:hypothetical protein